MLNGFNGCIMAYGQTGMLIEYTIFFFYLFFKLKIKLKELVKRILCLGLEWKMQEVIVKLVEFFLVIQEELFQGYYLYLFIYFKLYFYNFYFL